MSALVLAAKRLLRPLIPDRIMARYRLRQHSRQVRTNVDVVVDDPASRRRWLATTPDTYRVRSSTSFGPPPPVHRLAPGDPVPDGAALVLAPAGPAPAVDLAVLVLADPELDAGVAGRVGEPRLVGRRRVEPAVAPAAIAVRRAAWDEVGGAPPGEAPLPGLLDRLRDAGFRLGLVPVPDGAAARERTDPIDAPAVAILSAVPLHDVGGGSRGAQMALELLRRGYHVTFVSLYGTAESVDLGLRFVHPCLEQRRHEEFDAANLAARATEPVAVIAEMPAAGFLGPADGLRRRGFGLVYDLIDDWTDPSLGGEWYRPEIEASFVAAADGLAASAPDLAARLAVAGRTPALVPNGVNAVLFGGAPGPVPADFPAGSGPVIGYHGSLYGDWFDWTALAAVATANAEARVVVIGDDKGGRPPLPENVHFLGLKPQASLPDYVARFDVGLVPFVVSDVTHAVSPLKAYEYLACAVPVAAPPLRALEGVDGVYAAAALTDAVAAALAAPRPDRRRALAAHSWGARLRDLLGTIGHELRPESTAGAGVVVRPAVHYGRDERRV